MTKYFNGLQFISNVIKKFRAFKPIASVPPELRDEFNQLRLKNTVRRLKILCIVLLSVKFLKLISALFTDENMRLSEIKETFNYNDYFDLAVITAFLLLTGYFFNKNKRFISWFICCLFIIYNTVISLFIIPPMGSLIEVYIIKNPMTVTIEEPLPVTVSEVSNLRGSIHVTLTGTIEKFLGDEKYLFSDHTGNVTIEVDDEVFMMSSIDPTSLQLPAQFEITGEHNEGPRWSEIDPMLLFFWYIVLILLLPDLKPSLFIPFSVLYCLASMITISSGSHSIFVHFNSKIFVINIFLGVLFIKILLYNNKVRTSISTFKIVNLNKELLSTNKKLEALSITDELTKLNNRRSFLDYMDILWKQSYRLQLPITVIMIDIDYFKKYNDSLGHLEGDKALIAVAQRLKNQLKRETDFVARFGGEEFVCLIPYLEKTDAVNYANELVKSIEGMKIPHPMSEHSKYVTISAGIASIVPDKHSSQTQLLDEADKALYMAKQSGRNRAIIN